jgi:hypothetical protein
MGKGIMGAGAHAVPERHHAITDLDDVLVAEKACYTRIAVPVSE